MQAFITIIYVFVALVMVLSILLQAGKGGGLGSALGGGASQGVFGGGGGADFMSKLTQAFAATFMICAMYLAYASAHAGSDLLAAEGKKPAAALSADDTAIDYEFVGLNPQPLPSPEEGKAKQAQAVALVPAQSEAGGSANEQAEQMGDEVTTDVNDSIDRGDSPDQDRSDSPQDDEKSLQDAVGDDGSEPANGDTPATGSEAETGE